MYPPLQNDNEILPSGTSPVLEAFTIVQHRVRERNKLVEGAHDAIRQRRVCFNHLDGAEEERVPTPQVAWFGGIDLGAKPSSSILVVEDIVEELLDLRLNSGVVEEDTIRDHAVLIDEGLSGMGG